MRLVAYIRVSSENQVEQGLGLDVQRDAVHVGTGSHAVRLGEVRPEGRGTMAAADWMRGLHPHAHERME